MLLYVHVLAFCSTIIRMFVVTNTLVLQLDILNKQPIPKSTGDSIKLIEKGELKFSEVKSNITRR